MLCAPRGVCRHSALAEMPRPAAASVPRIDNDCGGVGGVRSEGPRTCSDLGPGLPHDLGPAPARTLVHCTGIAAPERVLGVTPWSLSGTMPIRPDQLRAVARWLHEYPGLLPALSSGLGKKDCREQSTVLPFIRAVDICVLGDCPSAPMPGDDEDSSYHDHAFCRLHHAGHRLGPVVSKVVQILRPSAHGRPRP